MESGKVLYIIGFCLSFYNDHHKPKT